MTTSRYAEALALAQRWHLTQLRKGTEIPYIKHLEALADLVAQHGGTEDERIAGLLHDSLKDAPTQEEAERRRGEIRARFGDGVLAVVEACTDAEPEARGAERALESTARFEGWMDRKWRYVEHLRTAAPSVLLVAAADKVHNADAIVKDPGTVGRAVFHRFKGERHGTLWYYRSLWAMLALRAEDEPRIGGLVGELEVLAREMGGR